MSTVRTVQGQHMPRAGVPSLVRKYSFAQDVFAMIRSLSHAMHHCTDGTVLSSKAGLV